MDLVEELFGESQLYEEENFETFERRYDGFGKELYSIIKAQLPQVFTHLKFYRAVALTGRHVGRLQHEDSYSIFSNGAHHFAIQLDYYSVIIIWNYQGLTYETGDWSEAPYEDALNYIKRIIEAK